MANIDVTKVEIKKRLQVRNLDIVLLYYMFAGFYLLATGDTILSAFVFYITIMTGIYTHTVALLHVQNKRRFLLDIMDYDLDDIWYPLLIWGFGLWILFFLYFYAIGAEISFATLDQIMFQVILVVPSETFIFVVFLPELLPRHFGRIPFLKIKKRVTIKKGRFFDKTKTISSKPLRIPGWFWGAGIFFGSYHFWAFQGDIGMIIIAIITGLAFYALFKLGDRNKNVGGIMASMSLHFVLNFWALSTVSLLSI